MIKVQIHSFEALDKGLRAEMTALRDAQTMFDSPFFDLDFAQIMANARADTRILVADDAQGLMGFWPLHQRPDNWARPIGATFSDWHGPVMRPGADAAMYPLEFLQKAGLKGMTATGLQPGLLSPSAGGELGGTGIAYMPQGAAAYLAQMKSLHGKHFKNLRRAERLIERDIGDIEFVADDTSHEAFEWLMTSKRAQYKRTGRHDVLAPDWVQTMMRTLHTKQFRRLRGRLSTLRLGGKLVAGEFDLLSDKVVHGWITVFDPDYAKYSPGHLLMLSVICDMENTGHIMCDVGGGDHAYKKNYESFQKPCESVTLTTARGLRPLATSWRLAERLGPAKLSGLMARMRRRGDQIFASELETAARLRGLRDALKGGK